MKWESYELYYELSRPNDIGQLEKVFVPIDNIECVISDKIYSNVTGEIAYRVVAPTGITKYKNLSTNNTYAISGEEHQYKVTGFSTKGRYTQLLLEETQFIVSKDHVESSLNGAILLNGEVEAIKLNGNKVVLPVCLDGEIRFNKEGDTLA